MEVDLIITQFVWQPTWLFLQQSIIIMDILKYELSTNTNSLSFKSANYIKCIEIGADVVQVILFNMWTMCTGNI